MTLLRLASLVALLAAASACTAPLSAGGQCSFNTDCAAGLVCAANYCRTPCGPGNTCPSGMRCEGVVGTAVNVCAPVTDEPRCVYASDCPAPLVCNRDGRCRPQCRTDYDCRVLNPFTTCNEGTCALACVGDAADCDGLVRNGCEVDTRTDVSHCGACGSPCRAGANQSVRCEAKGCVAACLPGFADCDADPANGCEADLADPANCGACTTRCQMPTSNCQVSGDPGARRYACVSRCSGDTPMECAGRCVDLQTDAAHCGGCGVTCGAGANATARCAAGRCEATCAQGFGDCDGEGGNGCEADLRTSVTACGACGRACAAVNATPTCSDGVCGRGACLAGFGDCDGDAANGCEAAFNTLSNCGACGTVCGTANATATCGVEGCALRCAQGFGDCDRRAANGCEANIASDDANCGACGNSCATRTTQTGVAHACQAGRCVPRNDTCATAQAIDLTAPTPLRVLASNRFATQDRTAPCTKGSGEDVWFRFTLTQPELVYADTVGATWDTVLYFATGCATPLSIPGETSQQACNDDVSALCKTGGTASQVYAVLAPGTYYLVLTGIPGEVGEVTLNVQHLPLGNGTAAEYPVGFFKGTSLIRGTLAGTGLARGTCGGDGPERSFWWATCPGHPQETLRADTCSPANNAINTVLYLRNGVGTGDVCSDDAPMSCPNGPRSAYIEAPVPGGAGVHTLTVDTVGAGGAYEVNTAYPYFTPR